MCPISFNPLEPTYTSTIPSFRSSLWKDTIHFYLAAHESISNSAIIHNICKQDLNHIQLFSETQVCIAINDLSPTVGFTPYFHILTSGLHAYLLLMMIATQLDSPPMMMSKVGFLMGIITCNLESHYKTHEINIFCPLYSLLLLNFQEPHLSKTLYWRLRWWLAFLPIKYFLKLWFILFLDIMLLHAW